LLLTELSLLVPDAPDELRSAEPVTAGIPFPPGVVRKLHELNISTSGGVPLPAQWQALDRWPADGSIRWALLDCQLDAPGTCRLTLGERTTSEHADPVVCAEQGGRFTIETAGWSCVAEAGSPVLLAATAAATSARRLVPTASDNTGRALPFVVSRVIGETVGPLRTTVRVDGTLGAATPSALNVVARVSVFAGLRSLRVELTVHNPRRARHPGGYWELGDPNSILLREVSLALDGVRLDGVRCSERPGADPIDLGLPATILQASSGGENWQSRVHVNRNGVVPLPFRGYELRAPGVQRRGDRSTPVLWQSADTGAAIAVRHFWQNFPLALEATPDRLVAHLFPGNAGDLHELQGGEQKTHVIGVALGPDVVAHRPLDWIARPALASPAPEWSARAQAAPYITPVSDPDSPYETLVRGAIEGPHSFEQKREVIDEYGWRNFGDIYADHENAFASSGTPIVSHYNNQYDGVNGFAIQFMRSGDARWWVAMDELARHVVDIDLYHTDEDKPAYSGGLFWHTYHYKDAGRSTHRCYPRAEGVEGGGPSNEQNYTTGLMHYYLMTGHAWAREAAIGLADWVIRMDDGRRTIFRWLSQAPTGLASSTASTGYHGPGRGAGNSIVSLLNAFRLTGSRHYLEHAELLIRRCIHPNDDVGARNLLDAERRWSYTVFLQALGRYLDDKATLGEADQHYAYARDGLIVYARWMADHEYPYLDRPEILEYPTETWAAHDMRKSEVFLHAARYVEDPERARFIERAAFFFRASLDWLHRFETRTSARPVVLMLSYGYMHESARAGRAAAPGPGGARGSDFGPVMPFVPQRAIATRRAAVLAAVAAAVALAAFGAMLARAFVH
jgi:hypothetical protein